MMRFETVATSGAARAGVLHSKRGPVLTPTFMPVGTQATVKSLDAAEVESTGARMIIMNTYHLWLRPGDEVVAALGGLHAMSRWPHLIATDSGGFQAFSLAERTKVSEEGVEFASHLDGTRRMLSPEESMRVQGQLGSDIAMQLDICPPGRAPRQVVLDAMDRTSRWARRCLAARRGDQAVFGIVQGGTDVDLRLAHLRALEALPFDGLALGGFSVGEPPAHMHRALAEVGPRMDPERIHYLMGVGTPEDLVRAIGAGVDLFDCVMPTRNARNGQAFVPEGKLVIKNARHRTDLGVLDPTCACPACAGGYSRGYLRHLYVSGEILVHRLLSLHNLHYYARLVAEGRRAVLEGRYAAWASEKLTSLGA